MLTRIRRAANAALPWATPIAVTAALILLAYTAFVPFSTNDDVGMRRVAAGRFVPGFGPDGHLVFTSAPTGVALARLYRLSDGVPWYDLILLAGTVLATVTIGSLLNMGHRGRSPLGLVATAALALPMFIVIQFSQVSGMLAAAGVLVLIRAGSARSTGTPSWAGPSRAGSRRNSGGSIRVRPRP
jgi:hypothetical protein